MWLNTVSFENRLIENERLELGAKDANYYLGPRLTLRHCSLVLRVPAKQLHLTGAEFVGCTLEAKKELKNLSWTKALLKGCTITGHLSGCDFGHWPDEALPHSDVGGIENCDLSSARLNGCRFFRCDVNTLRFPRWPYFTLFEPHQRGRELAALPWPGKLQVAMSHFDESCPEGTVALTRSATDLAARFGTTEAAIRAVLERIDGVYY